jgi:hypothetical protein
VAISRGGDIRPRRVAEPDGFRVMLDAAPAPRYWDIPDANFVL